MKADWLWDRKIDIPQAKKILKNPKNENFYLLASLLLARENEPKKVFKEYINPLLFCKQWPNIKRRMRKNKWDEPRIIFWQAVYEKLIDKYRKQGIGFRKSIAFEKDELCKMVGKQIKEIRNNQHLSQKELAEKMGISQQLISRIESGAENISLTSLKNISRALGKTITISLEERQH